MTKKIHKISVLIIVAASLASFGFVPSAEARTDCAMYRITGSITDVGHTSGQAIATVRNPTTYADDCNPVRVTFAAYKVFIPQWQPGWNTTQTLFDYKTITLGSGSEVQIIVNLPSCMYQIDIYEGEVDHATHVIAGIIPPTDPVCVNQPPQLTCSPSSQNVNVGTPANFSATGGTGTYSWTGGETPATGTGSNFSTSFSSSGAKIVTVSSGAQTAQCAVNVNQFVPPQLTCSPAEQGAEQNQNVNFSAQGGIGTYSWFAQNGTPVSGSGANFTSKFVNEGWNNVVVTSGSQTATCRVSILPPPDVAPLVCQPQTQTVNVGDIAVFSALGGTGSYTWTSPGSPTSGVGANFSSAFSSAGVKTVTVTDGTQTRQCAVTVTPPVQNLTCSPSTQTGNVNDFMTFNATGGGERRYNWSVSDGNPSTGNGSAFTTQFNTSGNKTITVTNGTQTATCSAVINQPVCEVPNATLNLTANISQNSATLNAYLDPHGKTTTYLFEYGLSPSYGYSTNQQTITTAQNVSASIYNLQPNTAYYYRIVVQNTCGTQNPGGNFTTTGNYNPPPSPQQTYCNPQNQNANVGDWVNFNATSGNGNYSWSTSGDASPSTGNGSNFGTRFSNNGTKIVTVNSSNGGSAQCIVTINTPQQNLNFQITKNVLNRTLGQTVYVNNVEAQAQDMVEFEIRVQTNGNNNNYQILLRDALPYGLTYVPGSTRVNGNQVPDGIIQNSGINLNNNYNQEQIIRFLATVDQGRANGTLTNQAFVIINSDTRNAYASVTIRPRGTVLGAADIVTGPEDTLPIVMTLGFLSAMIAYYFIFAGKNMAPKFNLTSVIAQDVAPIKPKKKTEAEKIIERLRLEEKSPDA